MSPAPAWRRVAGLFRLASPPRWGVPAIVLLGLGGAVLEGVGLVLFIPLLQSLGAPVFRHSRIERLFAGIDPGQMTTLLVALLCASIILKSVVGLINVRVTRSIHGRVAHGIRVRLFEQTLSSCVDFRPGVRRADIATMMTTDSWNVSRGLGIVLGIVVSAITAAVFAALMISISPILSFYALLFLCVAGVVVRFATRRADATGRAVVEENKQFGQRMWESIQGLQLIRAFGREPFETSRFRLLSDAVRRRMLKLEVLWAFPGPISEISIICLIGLLVLVADRTGVGIASLAALLSLLYRMQGPVRDLLGSTVALDSLWSSIDGVDELLRTTALPHLTDGSMAAPPVRSGIDLHGVSFRYGPDEPWALHDLSFAIPAGKTTAIIGESGAGKSTLMTMLFRFQDPTRGTITVDGIPLTALSLTSWRQRLALMSQEVVLLNDTVAANIAYGREGATRREIEAAGRTARAHDFITALPCGYETVVGDQGLRLSGGQRQRIALARTVLRDPDVLLLDEATNALDVESEQAFQLALQQYAARRTVIVIAHRLSTVRNADQIIVLAGGRVVEAGAPGALLAGAGPFARMFNLQHGSLAASVGA